MTIRTTGYGDITLTKGDIIAQCHWGSNQWLKCMNYSVFFLSRKVYTKSVTLSSTGYGYIDVMADNFALMKGDIIAHSVTAVTGGAKLAQVCCMDFPIIIIWASPYFFLWTSGVILFFYFCMIFPEP